jgi:hypothetical protein
MSAAYGKKTPTESVGASASTGLLDLNALRLPQDFAANLGVKKLLVNVPVTKPRKHWFVRSRPGDEWRTRVAMIVLKEEGENYVVDPRLAADLPDDVVHFDLVTAINRHGTVFLWQLRVPNNSRQDTWADSAIAACTHAETHWVKTTANMKASAYDVFEATGQFPEPEWPDETFEKLFHLAFREQVISSIDHPVLQQLKGAA